MPKTRYCVICGAEIKDSALKYCSDECREVGKLNVAKKWYKNNKDKVKKYNSKYYDENKERQKAVAQLYYLRHQQECKIRAQEYYRDHYTQWQVYNKYNKQSRVGTGFLGPHASKNWEEELEKLEKEKRRLNLN